MRVILSLCAAGLMIGGCSTKQESDDSSAMGSAATANEAADMTPEKAGIFDKLFNDGKPMKLAMQKVHPNQSVLTLNSIQVKPTETVVNFTVVNGHQNAITLASSDKTTYILSGGRQFFIVPPIDNKRLSVESGQTMTGDLVFIGAVPQGDDIAVIFNGKYGSQGDYTSTPTFKFDLGQATAAFSNDGSKKKSA